MKTWKLQFTITLQTYSLRPGKSSQISNVPYSDDMKVLHWELFLSSNIISTIEGKWWSYRTFRNISCSLLHFHIIKHINIKRSWFFFLKKRRYAFAISFPKKKLLNMIKNDLILSKDWILSYEMNNDSKGNLTSYWNDL